MATGPQRRAEVLCTGSAPEGAGAAQAGMHSIPSITRRCNMKEFQAWAWGGSGGTRSLR